MRNYIRGGIHVIGAGIMDIIPGLGSVGKMLGGGDDKEKDKGKSTESQIKEALEREKQRQRQEKLEHDQRVMMFTIFGVVGLAGAGAVAYLISKKSSSTAA